MVASCPSFIVTGIINLTHWSEEQVKDLDEFIERNEKLIKEREAEVLPTMKKMDQVSDMNKFFFCNVESMSRVCFRC